MVTGLANIGNGLVLDVSVPFIEVFVIVASVVLQKEAPRNLPSERIVVLMSEILELLHRTSYL